MSAALWKAVESASLKGIQAAIEAGASIDAIDDSNRDRDSVLGSLCKSQSGAMSKKEIASALWLIERGADVSYTNSDGATPLHLAVASGSHEVIDALIAHGARATADKYGNSPLHVAVSVRRQGHLDLGSPDQIGLRRERGQQDRRYPAPRSGLRRQHRGRQISPRTGRGSRDSQRSRQVRIRGAGEMDNAKIQKLLK